MVLVLPLNGDIVIVARLGGGDGDGVGVGDGDGD